jgi:hypothetical protein
VRNRLAGLSAIVIAAASVLAAAACASPRSASGPATTTVSAGESARTSPPPTPEATPSEPRAAAPAPLSGELVCKTTDASGVTHELFLDGSRALLRRAAPSGMAEVKVLVTQREGGMLIADVPGETDLVSHAATLREFYGKKYLRLGDYSSPFSPCE